FISVNITEMSHFERAFESTLTNAVEILQSVLHIDDNRESLLGNLLLELSDSANSAKKWLELRESRKISSIKYTKIKENEYDNMEHADEQTDCDSSSSVDESEGDTKSKRKRVLSKKNSNRKRGGEKKFECDECGRWFTRKDTLKAHKRSHLETEEPHKCDECDRRFGSTYHLECHKRNHWR
ncbi:hypothetical protein PMAYCL1PPCAC_09510, partial [Pristionchus mayeri]